MVISKKIFVIQFRDLIKEDGENISVIPAKKKLQIIAQNETHISIVMPCSSEVIDESGNIFRIEGPYILDCNESRTFQYNDQVITWRGQKCCGFPAIPSNMDSIHAQGNLKKNHFWKCGFCQNHCILVYTLQIKRTNNWIDAFGKNLQLVLQHIKMKK
jgi:hypothetical protein